MSAEAGADAGLADGFEGVADLIDAALGKELVGTRTVVVDADWFLARDLADVAVVFDFRGGLAIDWMRPPSCLYSWSRRRMCRSPRDCQVLTPNCSQRASMRLVAPVVK